MPPVYILSKLSRHSNRIKNDNSIFRSLNDKLLKQNNEHSSGLDHTTSDNYKISSTIQCRTRSLKSLKLLFDITNLKNELEKYKSQKFLFGINKPENIICNGKYQMINVKNLKELNKNNELLSDNKLYISQLKARISILAPECAPRKFGIILSKFLQSNIENLSIEELEYLHKLIIESNLRLNDSQLLRIFLWDDYNVSDRSSLSLMEKICKFVSNKHPYLSNISNYYLNNM